MTDRYPLTAEAQALRVMRDRIQDQLDILDWLIRRQDAADDAVVAADMAAIGR